MIAGIVWLANVWSLNLLEIKFLIGTMHNVKHMSPILALNSSHRYGYIRIVQTTECHREGLWEKSD